MGSDNSLEQRKYYTSVNGKAVEIGPAFDLSTSWFMDGDGKAVELGGPQEIKFELNKSNDMFTEVKGIVTWADPILPSSIYDELAKQVVQYGEDRFIRRVYGLPEHYIINNGATILFWKDGTKTIVKRSKDEKFDKRLGFLTAYFQKHCGMSKTKANKFLDTLEVDE